MSKSTNFEAGDVDEEGSSSSRNEIIEGAKRRSCQGIQGNCPVCDLYFYIGRCGI
jgi:hypothetical protein